MLLQQVRILCYLYLMVRTQQALNHVGQDGSRISLELLVEVLVAQASSKNSSSGTHPEDDDASSPMAKRLRFEQEGITVDALALWVSRLIARGFVKGYLSCEHRIVVLSKASPFPTLLSTS